MEHPSLVGPADWIWQLLFRLHFQHSIVVQIHVEYNDVLNRGQAAMTSLVRSVDVYCGHVMTILPECE